MATAKPRLSGVYPVLASPFREDGSPDPKSLRSIVQYVLKAGVHGVVFPAVASEFYALSDAERKELTEIIIEEVAGRVPVIVATSAPSAEIATVLSKHAERAGASAVMLMAPYVVKETNTGVIRYYERIADSVDIPIVLQNAPAPLGSTLSVDFLTTLISCVPAIRYVKEENPPCGQRISKLLNQAPESLMGVFGGAGGRYILDELNRGAAGTMPACELSELHITLYERYREGKRDEARALFDRMLPLLNFQSVFRSAMTKEVLKHRRIINSAFVRIGGIELDRLDQEELEVLLARVSDLLMETDGG